MTLHGAKIDVASVIGAGTKFSFTLSRAPAQTGKPLARVKEMLAT